MKKIGPILLIVLLSVVVVLGVRVYQTERNLNFESKLRNESYSKVVELQDKYQEEERLLLEETIKEVMILERKQDNHRKSIDVLRARIKIKEDWMDNPQKKWKVKDGIIVEVGKEVVLEQGE